MEAPPEPPPPRPTAGTRALTLLMVLLIFGVPLAACLWGARIQRRTEHEKVLNEALARIGESFAAYYGRYQAYPPGEEALVKFLRETPDVDADKLLTCPHCGGRLTFMSGAGEGSSRGEERPLVSHDCPVSGGHYVTSVPSPK